MTLMLGVGSTGIDQCGALQTPMPMLKQMLGVVRPLSLT